MKILFLTLSDETVASSRTRVFQYLPYLDRKGIRYRVIVYTPSRYLAFNGPQLRVYHFLILFFSLILSIFYPIVFIQKIIFPIHFINLLKAFGKRVIFDFDDAIYTLHQSDESKATSSTLDTISKYFNHTVASSDLVVLENETNLDIISPMNSNILMITGPIDTARYCPRQVSKSDDIIVIGWIGSPHNTFYLDPLLSLFAKICRKYSNVRFTIIGSSYQIIPGVDARLVAWNLQTEVSELQTFDIGIMPLPDDEWTRGKGGYKLLQYMALGIPSVASPVGINTSLIDNGNNGFLAVTETEWFDCLCLLIDNETERLRMGAFARNIAVESYSFEVASRRLINAVNSLDRQGGNF